jgi:hypothetical protein
LIVPSSRKLTVFYRKLPITNYKLQTTNYQLLPSPPLPASPQTITTAGFPGWR